MNWSIGIMLWLRFAMIQSDPPITCVLGLGFLAIEGNEFAPGGDMQEEHQMHAHLRDR
jgi:hypothetical protein